MASLSLSASPNPAYVSYKFYSVAVSFTVIGYRDSASGSAEYPVYMVINGRRSFAGTIVFPPGRAVSNPLIANYPLTPGVYTCYAVCPALGCSSNTVVVRVLVKERKSSPSPKPAGYIDVVYVGAWSDKSVLEAPGRVTISFRAVLSKYVEMGMVAVAKAVIEDSVEGVLWSGDVVFDEGSGSAFKSVRVVLSKPGVHVIRVGVSRTAVLEWSS